jgi:hypothetical protein
VAFVGAAARIIRHSGFSYTGQQVPFTQAFTLAGRDTGIGFRFGEPQMGYRLRLYSFSPFEASLQANNAQKGIGTIKIAHQYCIKKV